MHLLTKDDAIRIFTPILFWIFAAIFIRNGAKLAATMFDHNTRARTDHVLRVFLTVVLMQVQLCANGIQTHPVPE